jgi:hypothetical protein
MFTSSKFGAALTVPSMHSAHVARCSKVSTVLDGSQALQRDCRNRLTLPRCAPSRENPLVATSMLTSPCARLHNCSRMSSHERPHIFTQAMSQVQVRWHDRQMEMTTLLSKVCTRHRVLAACFAQNPKDRPTDCSRPHSTLSTGGWTVACDDSGRGCRSPRSQQAFIGSKVTAVTIENSLMSISKVRPVAASSGSHTLLACMLHTACSALCAWQVAAVLQAAGRPACERMRFPRAPVAGRIPTSKATHCGHHLGLCDGNQRGEARPARLVSDTCACFPASPAMALSQALWLSAGLSSHSYCSACSSAHSVASVFARHARCVVSR